MLRNGVWVRNALKVLREVGSHHGSLQIAGLSLAGAEFLPFLLSPTIKVMIKEQRAKKRPDWTQSFWEVCPLGMHPAGTLHMLEDVDEREKEEEEGKRRTRKDS